MTFSYFRKENRDSRKWSHMLQVKEQLRRRAGTPPSSGKQVTDEQSRPSSSVAEFGSPVRVQS